MLDEDDGLRLILGMVFGVIALVISLVIGMGIYKSHHAKTATAAVVVVEEAFAAVEPVGDAMAVIYFAVGEAVVPAEAGETLAKVKTAVTEKEGVIVLLSGFHDETGDAAMNAELAKNRAKAVKASLVAAGVPVAKVLIRKPAVTLGTGSPEEARRVEIRVQ